MKVSHIKKVIANADTPEVLTISHPSGGVYRGANGEPSTNDCVFALANGASGVTIDERLYSALL